MMKAQPGQGKSMSKRNKKIGYGILAVVAAALIFVVVSNILRVPDEVITDVAHEYISEEYPYAEIPFAGAVEKVDGVWEVDGAFRPNDLTDDLVYYSMTIYYNETKEEYGVMSFDESEY